MPWEGDQKKTALGRPPRIRRARLILKDRRPKNPASWTCRCNTSNNRVREACHRPRPHRPPRSQRCARRNGPAGTPSVPARAHPGGGSSHHHAAMRTAPDIGTTDDNDLFHVGSGVLQFWTLDRTAQSVRRALATVAVKAKAQAIIKFRISPPSKWLPEPVPAVPLLLVMERGGNAIQMGAKVPDCVR